MLPANDVADQAAGWLVRLHAGELDDAGRQALAAWRAQHPDHERAWQAAETLAGTLGAIPAGIGTQALRRSRQAQRRRAAKTIALLLAAPAAGWLGWRQWGAEFAAELVADHRTATGQRSEIQLADGSLLHLNTASAADVRFDAAQRRIVLQAGEILIHTAPDSIRPPRPFVVQTEHGTIRALGTRFIVQRESGRQTRVSVLEHAVEIRPALGNAARRLDAGQSVRFSAHAVGPIQPAPAGGDAWRQGNLIADKQRLEDFLAELSRHRPGILRCAPEVADLRISGVFQLDDTDRILAILQEDLPISVRRRTRYWVNVHPREAG
ncbi:FecR domain-containing protein [Thauera linaloolentis]|nr:FecR domain-containing protein [Thauera linaloolentis]MCM8567297.1 FecR domain-containing protein [Thauera linaloolentis]